MSSAVRKRQVDDSYSRIRIGTYNIHQYVGTDSTRSVERIGRALKRLDADIVGLQEVDTDSNSDGRSRVELLSRITGLEPLFGPAFIKKEGDYGNLILSRFPLEKRSSIDLSYMKREPRSAIVAETEIGKTQLRVIVTHFGLSRRERNWQVEKLLDELPSQRRSVEVLLVDTNEWWPFASTLRKLTARFGEMCSLRSFPSRWPLLSLDRIWINRPALVEKLERADGIDFRVASDHLPLIATVRLSNGLAEKS